jgi:Transposase
VHGRHRSTSTAIPTRAAPCPPPRWPGSAWEDQLLAYFSTGGVSNGPTEAVNVLVKRIKRAGFGFRKLRQLPAPLAAALRRQLAHSPTDTDSRPVTTFYGVEPLKFVSRPRGLPRQ